MQGHNEVAPVARSKFGVPMLEPEVIRKQKYCIEESTCDIVETFGTSRSHSALPAVILRPLVTGRQGNCSPLVTPLPPCTWCYHAKIALYRICPTEHTLHLFFELL